MKPIKLVMKAFGPYANEQIIDFNKLEDQLYLITGPTGAGKTTIFDGISYALYGRSSGESRQIEDARSHFASDNVLTEVVLDFELSNKFYRVHRIPGQMRKAKRGNRMTKQKAEAVLYVDDMPISKDALVITGIKEVNEQIESIIGVNEEQFKQIMMIPQGEFRKLLTEGSSEREKVLGRLFDTSLYRMIQERLNDMSKDNRVAIEKLKTESQGVLKLVALSDQDDHPLNQAVTKDDIKLVSVDQVIHGIQALRLEDERQLKDVNQQLESLDKAYSLEIQKRERAEYINKLHDKLKVLKEKQHSLLEKQETMGQLENRLKQADQGLKVMPKYKQVKQQLGQIKTQEQVLASQENRLVEVDANFKAAKVMLDQVESDTFVSQLSDLKEEQLKLRGIGEKLDEYIQAKTKIDRLKVDMEKQSDMMISANEALDKAKKQLGHIKDQMVEYEDVKENAGDQKLLLVKEQAIEEKLMALIEQIMKGIDRIGEYNRALSYEEETANDLRDMENQWKRLRIQHHMNQAAILAQELEDGEPCPVCGSLDHPQKAKSMKDTVTDEMLEEIEKQVESSRRLNQKASEKTQIKHTYILNHIESVITLVSDLEGEGIGFDADVHQLKDHAIDLWKKCHKVAENKLVQCRQDILGIEKNLSKLHAKVRLYEDQQKKRSSLENMMSTLEIEVKDADAGYNKAKLLYSESKGRLEGLGRDIPDLYLEMGVLNQEALTVKKAISDMEAKQVAGKERYDETKEVLNRLEASIKASEDSILSLNQQLKIMVSEFNQALRTHGFSSEESFLEAIIDTNEYDVLKDQMSQYQKEMIETSQSIKDLQSELVGSSIQQLEVFDENMAKMKKRREAYLVVKDQLTHRITKNHEVKQRLETINKEINQVKSAYEKIGRLASVAGGRNSLNMTFERYVLAQLLQDITKAANLRLEQMSGGRFRLLRAEGTRDGRKSGGLDLAVSDNYTGTVRPVTSLSGGEMFKASLSMALGLSDVVQSYTGGVKLDAMFIDEGFGSLDQTSLDQAINCLIDLQKTGRSIGIISHVAELKERISTRIEIEPSLAGSRAKIISG